MLKKIYHINQEWDGKHNSTILFEGDIELDDIVINSVDDSWRRTFYDFSTPQQIAEHIAFNMVVNDLELSDIDGFADLSNNMAKLL